MAISLKHAFASAKSDGPDSTQVQPSNWNAEHNITMATARLLGRTTASTGAVEEISVGATLLLSAGVLALATNPTVGGNLSVTGTLGVTSTSQFTGAVGIGGAAVASSLLDIQSTTKGVLFPRMTTVQRDAIGTPATGLTLFNTTTGQMEFYTGAAWAAVGPAIGSVVQAWDADLDAIAALATTGILVRTGAATYTLRTLTAGNDITITNADGVSGSPTIAVDGVSAKGWVKFNAATGAILGSHNVSSVTDNGVGDFTVNWTVAAPNANYAVSAISAGVTGNVVNIVSQGTSSVRVELTRSTTGAAQDATSCHVVAFW
jgi:hypothetical protein